jgi:hypothetical protein
MSPPRIRARWVLLVACVLLAVEAALLIIHYAGFDVVAKYTIDGVLVSWRYEDRFQETLTAEFSADRTGKVIQVTVHAQGRQASELAACIPPASRVRLYYERRAVWLPWEGSTRRAVGFDLLGPEVAAP